MGRQDLQRCLEILKNNLFLPHGHVMRNTTGGPVMKPSAMIQCFSSSNARMLLQRLEVSLRTQSWAPIDWLVPEIIGRSQLPIYLANTAVLRLVGSPFRSIRRPD